MEKNVKVFEVIRPADGTEQRIEIPAEQLKWVNGRPFYRLPEGGVVDIMAHGDKFIYDGLSVERVYEAPGAPIGDLNDVSTGEPEAGTRLIIGVLTAAKLDDLQQLADRAVEWAKKHTGRGVLSVNVGFADQDPDSFYAPDNQLVSTEAQAIETVVSMLAMNEAELREGLKVQWPLRFEVVLSVPA